MSINTSYNNDSSEKKFFNAILFMFPDIESFHDFIDDTPKTAKKSISRIIQFAYENELINSASEDDFTNFIMINSKNNDIRVPEITFSELIDDITQKTSANSLINAMNFVAETFNMPHIQPSMLSRLKKKFKPNTAKQKNIIRLLAYWIGKNRPSIGLNYNHIIALNKSQDNFAEITINETEGVRIAFSLQSCGDIINAEAIDWLRKTLPQCIKSLNLNHINPKRIKYSLTSAYINIDKAPGPKGEPRLYSSAIRDSLAIAHQISVKWLLSKHSSQDRIIIVAIAAGQFDILVNQTESLISTKIQWGHSIRMNSFARLCSRIADVKIVFHDTPYELRTTTGVNVTAWSVSYLWTYLYYDFVPELLNEKMLPIDHENTEQFKNEIFFPELHDKPTNPTILAINKFPQDPLLSIEIAKVLTSRRMFHEALKILSDTLASNPEHIVARCARMAIYRIMFIHEKDPGVSEKYFHRAAGEAKLIERQHTDDIEANSECGLVYYSQAIHQISVYLSKESQINNGQKEKIIDHLNKAYEFFNYGASIAPGINIKAECLCIHTQIIKKILLTKKYYCQESNTLTDTSDIIHSTILKLWNALGLLTESTKQGVDGLMNRFLSIMYTHLNNIKFRIYLPCIKFFSACLLWDGIPLLTVGHAKFIISVLLDAINDAHNLKRDKTYICANVNSLTQMQSPDDFIDKTQNVINRINDIIQEDLLQNDDYEIPRDKINSLQLMLLYLVDFCDSKPLIDKQFESAS